MSSVRELQRLQGLDNELAARRERLAQIEEELAEVAALEDLRQRTGEARHELSGVEREQRDADWEVEETRRLVATVERKLYSGEVKNPKELVSLQEEVDSLKGRQRRQEDVLIETMSRLESAQTQSAGLSRELVEAEAARSQLEQRSTEEREQLQQQMGALSDQRKGIAQRVPVRDLDVYESLLRTKQGRAVAKVERAMCQGCRITIPMSVQQRLRADRTLVQCPSCQRILYLD